MIRSILSVFALLSPFLFPYPVTIILSAAASVFFPPIGFLAGLVADVLYYTPSASIVPVAALLGLSISVAGLFVRRFFKARIIGG